MTDRAVSEFESHRRLLLSIAYRMLANVADAEDVVQDAYVRWQSVDHDQVRSPKAFLTSVVTRLAIDHIRAANVRERDDLASSLPEPVTSSYLSEDAALADSLSVAFLVMLRKLSPIERAAFLLREVFGHDYDELASILGKSEANCRQIVHRARERLAAGHSRFKPSKDDARRLVGAFEQAVAAGDVRALLELLSPDVTVYADGGEDRPRYGNARAITRPISGGELVARFLVSIQAQAPGDVATRIADVNGAPALLAYRKGTLFAVLSFEIVDGLIRNVFIQQDLREQSGLSALRYDA